MGSRIVLNKRDNTIKVVNRKTSVKLSHNKNNIKLQHAGRTGPKGEGIPASGGNPGDVLTKTPTGTKWSAFAGTDKYFEQAFSSSSVLSVIHNLSKFPAVTVHDSAGDEVEGNVVHVDDNSLIVTFSAPFSGKITCN